MQALVIGSARSGIAAAKLLLRHNYDVIVSDHQPIAKSSKASLKALGVTCYEGHQDSALLEGIDLVVTSPGVPPTVAILRQANAQNIDVTTEACLALRYYKGDWIGITGTNGKSTTTVMVSHLLSRLGHAAYAGGNLGRAACEIICTHDDIGILVLELSSYQLQFPLPRPPTVAVFTSFAPDHLERHGSIENYFAAKWSLFSSYKSFRILSPSAAESAAELGYELEGCVIAEPSIIGDQKLPIYLAPHDISNASCALLAASRFCDKRPQHLLPLFDDFKGLAHRFQVITKNGSKPVINDSKAINVASTLTALASLESPQAILLLGGQAKEESFAPISEKSAKIKAIVTFGKSGAVIADELSNFHPPVMRFKSLAEAMQNHHQWWQNDTTILFSPACASFDEFSNFEERGEFFTRKISEIVG